ncbi:hypothetical protein [Paenibacillus sp. B-A-8]|uniref:hypothetical protein n=1 Tax=Paenibacillus sp. B-A-8 TaxID=3400419 RepID=UPI003B023CCB
MNTLILEKHITITATEGYWLKMLHTVVLNKNVEAGKVNSKIERQWSVVSAVIESILRGKGIFMLN